jgi:hypothetical protein
MVSNRRGAGTATKEKASVRDPQFGKEVFIKSLANEGQNTRSLDVQQSRRQFRESIHRVAHTYGWLALSMRHLLTRWAQLGLAVLPVSKSENLTAG